MTTPAPPILRTAVVARPVDEAFAVFTDEIGAWWPLPTHSLFQGEAGGVHFVGDRLIERATDGRETTWAEVLTWEPPKRLVLAWHPGSADGPAGRVELRFTSEGEGTRVELRHDGWEAFGEAAMQRRRDYAGPSAWGHVLDHFADGAEHRLDRADLSALAAAYEAFFAEAEAGFANGGFTPPTDGGWTAEQVVAHVALNDLALTAVAHSLIHRKDEPAFGNHACQVIETLDAVVEACGDADGLIAHGRRCATQAVAAAGRLDPDQRDQPVACTFEHDGEVVGEGPMPWAQVAIDIQAARHLAAHVEQLQNLRS